MEKQFIENFATISINFNQVFTELFGGGKAYLKLTDEENILESGIEIIAQPQVKLQNMMFIWCEKLNSNCSIIFHIKNETFSILCFR